MRFKILAYLFFVIGFLDIVSKLFFGDTWEIVRDNYEFLGSFTIFTPVLFIAIGGAFLKESRVQLSSSNYGTTRFKYYTDASIDFKERLLYGSILVIFMLF